MLLFIARLSKTGTYIAIEKPKERFLYGKRGKEKRKKKILEYSAYPV